MHRILYVYGGQFASGAEIVIERLIRYNSNFQTNYLFVSPGDYSASLIESNPPYKIFTKGYLKKLDRENITFLRYIQRLIVSVLKINFDVLRFVYREKIEVVHVNSLASAFYLCPLILIFKIVKPKVKWLWSVHDLKYLSSADELIAKICLFFYDKILAVSNAVKDKFKDCKGFKKITVLYNGLDIDFFKKKEDINNLLKNKLDINEDTILIGIAAFIDKRKGQLELIKVFNDLHKTNRNIFLLLAGKIKDSNDDYTKDVVSLISNSKNILHLGQVSDMVAFYNSIDIIINNSNKEGSEPLGTTIYEAMACERLVLASNTGGSPEIINDKKDGLLFDVDNKADLFRVLDYAVNNVKINNVIQKSARQKVMNKFNLLHMTENYNKIIEQIL